MSEQTDSRARIHMGHGSGGRATGRLIQELFVKHLHNERLDPLDDGALLDLSGSLAMSTDAFVVDPIFFPGGDIGKLAVCGTVNDVAMCGAVPRALSAAFILEEGLLLEDLERIARSMGAQAREAGVEVVTGDTKVVPRGHADGVYVTTAGVGERIEGVRLGGALARPGDVIMVSGPLGDHGAAIMAVRAGIDLEGDLRSDCASVAGAVVRLLQAVPGVHVLRDPTRGGLASVVVEIAEASKVGVELEETAIPVSEATLAACEILGLDPLSLACEGRFVAILPAELEDAACQALSEEAVASGLCRIGRVVDDHPGKVVLRTQIGGTRLVDQAEGELLPRIC